MVSKKTGKAAVPSGHRFFDQVRADEAKARSESQFSFAHGMRRWLVSFEGAAAELGVTDGDLLDLAYQRKIFFVFHRPSGVQVRRVAEFVQHYDEDEHIGQPTFLVLPSGASFDLHFQDRVDLWDVEMAMSFSHTRGLAGLKLDPERPANTNPLAANLFLSLNARPEDWKAAWGCWGFLRNGTRSSVSLTKKDLFLPVEELALARAVVWETRGGESISLHSRHLHAAIEASHKFWIESGAAIDASVAEPDNAEVAEWLMQRGLSKTLANRTATLIRPETASAGRKSTRKQRSDEKV